MLEPEFLGDQVYGEAPYRGASKTLHVDLYLPDPTLRPAPLFVWWHGGGFRNGQYHHVEHRKLARQLNREGFAVAAPEYRLRSKDEDLASVTRAKMPAIEAQRMEGFRENLSNAQAHAAMEDAIRVLVWLEAQRERLGFAGKFVLGGSSAGAITAINAVQLAPHIGLDRPDIGGIIGFSGGFAFPDLYEPELCPVFAMHNPADQRVDIASIRTVAAKDASVMLLECADQEHGGIRIHPGEPKKVHYGRIRSLVAQMSGVAPKKP